MSLDACSALMAARIGKRLVGMGAAAQRLRNRITGGLLILAGIGLALVRKG